MTRNGFGKLPDWFVREAMHVPGMTVYEFVVFGVLVNRANKHGTCYPSHDLIGKDGGGISRNRVAKAIKRLIELGYVELVSAGRGTSNSYRVHVDRPASLDVDEVEIEDADPFDGEDDPFGPDEGHWEGAHGVSTSDAIWDAPSDIWDGGAHRESTTCAPGEQVGAHRERTKNTHQEDTSKKTHIEPRAVARITSGGTGMDAIERNRDDEYDVRRWNPSGEELPSTREGREFVREWRRVKGKSPDPEILRCYLAADMREATRRLREEPDASTSNVSSTYTKEEA